MASAPMTSAMTPDLKVLASPFGFAATLERVAAAIAAAGLTVFARIDHAANAHDAGLTMLPAVVLIYGHAKGGTPIMAAHPDTALDLPLRVLVRADDAGHASVAFHPVAPMLRAAGVADGLASRLEPAQLLLARALEN